MSDNPKISDKYPSLVIQGYIDSVKGEPLTGDYLWQEVEIVIGGVATVLEVHFMSLFMSLGRILLQGSILTNLFGSIRHQVDLWTVKVGI